MKNADLPAMPNPVETIYDTINNDSAGYGKASIGLTKREIFAMHAMQGIASNDFSGYTGPEWAENIAAESVKLAGALLKELEK